MANPTKEIDGASTHPSSPLASLSDGHFMIPLCCVLLHLISNHVTGALGGSGLLVRFLEPPIYSCSPTEIHIEGRGDVDVYVYDKTN